MDVLLTNPWMVGVGGGVLSGLIVTFVSHYLLSRRDNQEYLQKIELANREILYAIRPSISEGCLPTREVVMALIASSSRKYGVEEINMYTPEHVADDLIKEVMDSSFIPAKTKLEYCQHLTRLNKTTEIPGSGPNAEQIEYISNYRRKMLNLMSVVMGMTVALMTFMVAFLEWKPSEMFPSDLLKLSLPTVLGMLSSLLAAILMLFLRSIKRKEAKIKSNFQSTDKTKDKPFHPRGGKV